MWGIIFSVFPIDKKRKSDILIEKIINQKNLWLIGEGEKM